MGRFGNVMLVCGEPDLSLTAKLGEVVRLYFTNTANTRVFKVKLPGARMKLVGGDSGHFEHEKFVEEVILSPSERVMVDVLFDAPASTRWSTEPQPALSAGLDHRQREPAEPQLAEQFAVLRTNADLAAERERIARILMPRRTRRSRSSPRWTSTRLRETGRSLHVSDASEHRQRGAGTLPECGMKLLAVEAPTSYVCPMHPQVISEHPITARSAA